MTDLKNIAWIDLETTSADEHDGSILEVGIIITDPHLRELDRAEWLVEPLDIAHIADMPDVVRRMHTESGLLDRLDEARADEASGRRRFAIYIVDEVDALLRELLDTHTVRGQIILAGSGVGHFDSRWIRRHLPRSAQRLTYWALDVGVVRRFLATIDPDLVLEQYPDGGKPHRALADAELHLAEWRAYRDAMRETALEFRVALARKR